MLRFQNVWGAWHLCEWSEASNNILNKITNSIGRSVFKKGSSQKNRQSKKITARSYRRQRLINEDHMTTTSGQRTIRISYERWRQRWPSMKIIGETIGDRIRDVGGESDQRRVVEGDCQRKSQQHSTDRRKLSKVVISKNHIGSGNWLENNWRRQKWSSAKITMTITTRVTTIWEGLLEAKAKVIIHQKSH